MTPSDKVGNACTAPTQMPSGIRRALGVAKRFPGARTDPCGTARTKLLARFVGQIIVLLLARSLVYTVSFNVA